MKQNLLLTCGLFALVSGTALILSTSMTALADPPLTLIDCDCEKPSDAETVCKTDLNKCETQDTESLCTSGFPNPSRFRTLDFPKECRATESLLVCNEPEKDCYIQVLCTWDATRTPKCQTGGDAPSAVWQKETEPTEGMCPAGATKCAPR